MSKKSSNSDRLLDGPEKPVQQRSWKIRSQVYGVIRKNFGRFEPGYKSSY